VAEKPKQAEETDIQERPKTAVPRKFKVIFHNDDYTSMEFVTYALCKHFRKSESEALHLTLTIHHKGNAVAGVYARDVAESKVAVVTDEARALGMPLLLTTEPDEPGP
jgi:ATP-dependent Clp protease adaptor protein ClpS